MDYAFRKPKHNQIYKPNFFMDIDTATKVPSGLSNLLITIKIKINSNIHYHTSLIRTIDISSFKSCVYYWYLYINQGGLSITHT